jgi:hypothetical protein
LLLHVNRWLGNEPPVCFNKDILVAWGYESIYAKAMAEKL